MKLASVDVAGSRHLDCVWILDHECVVHHELLPTPKDALEWIEEQLPDVIAIDAPSKRNCERTGNAEIRQRYGWKSDSFLNCRVCEALLKQRNIGLYYTPRDSASDWIETGWELYGGLERMGFNVWDQPGPVHLPDAGRTVIEVHPHACFVIGLGWIPQDKRSFVGQLERAAYLRQTSKLQRKNLQGAFFPGEDLLTHIADRLTATSWQTICAKGITLPALPHDVLDALGGLVTTIACVEGQAFAIGEPEEGVIVVPRKPQPVGQSYRTLRGD
jgi:predicted nuclease with RNAse H fold